MMLFLVAFIAQATPDAVQLNNRAFVVSRCVELFGRKVEDSPLLFEINRYYVLQVEFGKDDKVARAVIQPKFYYADDHPDWEEPDDFEWLSTDQVTEMLGKLDRLQPLGKLVQRYKGVIIVTNLTARYTDDYEKAAVTRGEVFDLRRPASAPVLVRGVAVRYKTTF